MLNIQKGISAAPPKVVIYGPEGIGKSTLASKFPAPLFIDVEEGTGRMDVARLTLPDKSFSSFKSSSDSVPLPSRRRRRTNTRRS